MLKKGFAFLATLSLIVLVGCGGGSGSAPAGGATGGGTSTGGGGPKKEPKKTAGGAAKEAYAADKHKGSVKGLVAFEGEAPKQPKIDTSGDKKCHDMHASEPLLKEEVIVKDGKLKNVIVYLKSGTDKFSYETPANEVVIDQKGCQYIPHVAAVMVEQKVTFTNSDDLLHNVHGKGKSNPEFNISQAKAGVKDSKKLAEPELPYTVGCDVHKWMNCKIGVFDHPFFAVTGDDGAFEIKGVPAGDYEVEAWHETLGTQTGKATVAADGSAEVKFSFKGK